MPKHERELTVRAVHAGAEQETAEWAATPSGTILKDMINMERTKINETGGKFFEKQRMPGSQEQPYMHSNQILA